MGRYLDDEQIERLRTHSLKPDEIAGDQVTQIERVRELLGWFASLTKGSANPKWTTAHACELAFYIATTDLLHTVDVKTIRMEAWKEGVSEPQSVRDMAVRHGWVEMKPDPSRSTLKQEDAT